MKPLIHAVVVGAVLAALKVLLVQSHMTLWDISLVSLSGQVAGVFFVLGMIFASAIKDFKDAELAVSKVRGLFFALNDLNLTAAIQSEKKHDPAECTTSLQEAMQSIKDYLELKLDFFALQKKLKSLLTVFQPLHPHLTADQVPLLTVFHKELRSLMSELAYAKDIRFPAAGYLFLYFFITLLIVLQLFSNSENLLLGSLFMFSFSSILVFFAELIRDLDHPFNRKGSAFLLDTEPLANGIKVLGETG